MPIFFQAALIFLILFFSSLASAGPSYIGEYRYTSWRCNAYYGPFKTLDQAVKTASEAEYGGMGCGSPSIVSSQWSTQDSSVQGCGGSVRSVFVEGVESSAQGSFLAQYSAGKQCENTYRDSFTVSRYRLVCRSDELFFEDLGTCDTIVKYYPPATDPKNNGPQCPDCSRGDPVNPLNGNNWRIDVDYENAVRNGLSFSRYYNSNSNNIDADSAGFIGSRWKHTYDRRLKTVFIDSPRFVPVCYRRWSDKKSYCSSPIASKETLDIAAMREDGKIFYFDWDGNNYIADADVKASVHLIRDVSNSISGWRYSSADGEYEIYDAAGRLIEITQLTGEVLRLTYSDGLTNNTSESRKPNSAPSCRYVQDGMILPEGLLLCVTDHAGRQLQFGYNNNGLIEKMIDPSGAEIRYGYNGLSSGCDINITPDSLACKADNLTSVVFSDGSSRTYWYNELPNINNGKACFGIPSRANSGNGFGHLLRSLTGIIDENNDRFATWGYDCDGNTTENFLGNGVAKVRFSFGLHSEGKADTYVYAEYGDASAPIEQYSTYRFETILGVGKNTNIHKSCAHCGSVASRSYDANGNLASEKNWNGIITNYTYDLIRNLEVKRVEAVGTAQERTTTTRWHPALNLKTSIAEPKKITTNEYDSAGNLLKRTLEATNDPNGTLGINAMRNGAARTWKYSYSPNSQLLSVTGPRTDVVDHTVYTYDGQGNLATIANALGQITSYSNYDANGRVGRMVAPNGLITDIAYNSRGWITSQIVGDGVNAETTGFVYDGVGQITKVTYPDGSYMAYSYDTAHRLIKVLDNSGNSVTYTLDTLGNRTLEQVTGPDGILTRKISRVFDTLNNLQRITGAVQ